MKFRRQTRWTALLAALVLGLGAGASHGGSVFFAGQMIDGEFQGDARVEGPCFSVPYSSISATISATSARTRVEETIVGSATGLVDSVCVIPLPPTVFRDGIQVTTTADDGDSRVHDFTFLDVKAAKKLYRELAGETDAVTLLAYGKQPALLIPVVSLGRKLELVVSYRQELRAQDGVATYTCPMPVSSLMARKPGRLTVSADIENATPLRGIFSPTHAVEIERKGLRAAQVRLTTDEIVDEEDFQLLMIADADPLGIRVFTHHAEGDDDGYFMLVGHPSGDDDAGPGVAKDIVFALDVSGSMRGEKMEQARLALEYCLDSLNPGDRFNIVAFGTEVRTFRKGVVARTAASIHAAKEFVDDLVAVGRTNIGGALAAGLRGEPADGRTRIMIFLTDGTPTAGELVPEKIVAMIPEMNTSETHVYVMGVGHDVNAHLLDRVAEETNGSAEYVDPDEEIDVKVASLYNRLSHPVLENVQVAFGGLETYGVYPKKLIPLFQGSDFILAGRYRRGGRHEVVISGTLGGAEKQFSYDLAFPQAAEEGGGAPYVASLWAARKIGYLLQEVRLHGENKELTDEVVRLSKQFGIVTEYTMFIAEAGGAVEHEEARLRAQREIRVARGQKGGQWGVQQARNDKEMQNRQVAASSANVFRDGRGREVKSAKVKQAGGRTYYRKASGQWVDAAPAGDRKKRTVKLYSDEYYELLDSSDDFAKAQRVGRNVSVNIGEERIELSE